MRTMLMSAALAAIVSGGAAIAPGEQSQTVRPGELTKGEVSILNRGRGEAVPVSLEGVAGDQLLRVVVMNGDPAAPGTSPVRTRSTPLWQYRIERLSFGKDDPSVVLNGLGSNGWETSGVVWQAPDGQTINVLMKRQQPQ